MTRLLAMALAAGVLAGCGSYQYQATDPIYGRQTIPSQRTGAVGSLGYQTPSRQYYDDQSGATSSVPNPPSAGGNAPPPRDAAGFQGGLADPPSSSGGGWGPPDTGNTPSRPVSNSDADSRGAIPFGSSGQPDFGGGGSDYGKSTYENFQPKAGASDSFNTPPPSTSYPPPGSGTNSRGFDPLRRLRDDRPAQLTTSGRSASGSAPGRRSPDDIVDIRDLPDTDSSRDDILADRGVQPASYIQPLRQPAAQPPPQPRRVTAPAASASVNPTDPDKPYDYDPDYRWLKGKLQYSNLHHRWTLRYIPINGKSDDFGGSVMLQDAPELASRRNGEVIVVYGAVLRDEDPSSFTPLYRVDQASALR